MALEDIAMFRALPNSTVFYPSDAVSAERSVELAANLKGIRFIRTSRPANKGYDSNEEFAVGKCKVLNKSGGSYISSKRSRKSDHHIRGTLY